MYVYTLDFSAYVVNGKLNKSLAIMLLSLSFFYKIISFLKLRLSSLCGKTMLFKSIFSEGTCTKHPEK